MQPLRIYPACLFCLALSLGSEVVAQMPVLSVPVVPSSSNAPVLVSPAPSPAVTTTVAVLTPGAGSAPGSIINTVNDQAWDSARLNPQPASGTRRARLINLSARARVGSDSETLIAGAGISGAGKMPILARGIGPGLRPFGVADAIAYAPTLTVYRDASIAAQSNIIDSVATKLAAQVGAFPGQSSNPQYATGDAALVGEVEAGTLTAHCTAQPNDTGLGMVEFYDAGSGTGDGDAHFVNFSARSTVGSGSNVLIVGFVVQGEGSIGLLLRASGTSLQQFGVSNPLADPVLELYSGDTLLASNDDWQQTDPAGVRLAANSVAAFPQTSAKDSALLVTLTPGSYTLHVRGASPAFTGVALAEIYTVAAVPSFDATGATNALGLDLFRQLGSRAPGNLIISPYSIETAFALAYAGAAGDTRIEMARVLHFPPDNGALVRGLSAMQSVLDTTASDSIPLAKLRSVGDTVVEPITWQLANRVFGQSGFPFRDSYLATVADGFGAPLQSLDFEADPEAARATINNWVAGITHDKILDLLPFGSVKPSTRFALVNALYLKAPWDEPFGVNATDNMPFTLTNGSSVPATMMHATRYLGYSAQAGYSAVTLPYLGTDLQFVVILPDATESVDALMNRLSAVDIANWSKLHTSPALVALTLPKFKATGDSISLKTSMEQLGMTSAFSASGAANFDGIAPRDLHYLYITDAFHKTFVAVDEQGTEAAAATALIGATATSVPIPAPVPIVFTVDRPFLFAIQHRGSGVVLFIGRITQPTS